MGSCYPIGVEQHDAVRKLPRVAAGISEGHWERGDLAVRLARRGSAAPHVSKASKSDTEFHGGRHGVPRSRHYCAARRKPLHGASSSARSAKCDCPGKAWSIRASSLARRANPLRRPLCVFTTSCRRVQMRWVIQAVPECYLPIQKRAKSVSRMSSTPTLPVMRPRARRARRRSSARSSGRSAV